MGLSQRARLDIRACMEALMMQVAKSMRPVMAGAIAADILNELRELVTHIKLVLQAQMSALGV